MNPKITISAKIQADLKKVWEYYTNPLHIVHWNFAHPSWHCPIAENNLVVGGMYNARMEARDGSFGFDFKAIYTEIKTGESFQYRLEDRNVAISFEPIGLSTEIRIVFDPETENPIEMQQAGWQSILNNFKEYTENH